MYSDLLTCCWNLLAASAGLRAAPALVLRRLLPLKQLLPGVNSAKSCVPKKLEKFNFSITQWSYKEPEVFLTTYICQHVGINQDQRSSGREHLRAAQPAYTRSYKSSCFRWNPVVSGSKSCAFSAAYNLKALRYYQHRRQWTHSK